MESIIVLVAILAYLEFRDQKSQKRFLKNARLIKGQVSVMQARVTDLYSLSLDLEKVSRETKEAALVISEVRAIAEDSRIKIDSILKEYQINGVPLGWERRAFKNAGPAQFDAVEGL